MPGWEKLQMQVVEVDRGVRRECRGRDVRSYFSCKWDRVVVMYAV